MNIYFFMLSWGTPPESRCHRLRHRSHSMRQRCRYRLGISDSLTNPGPLGSFGSSIVEGAETSDPESMELVATTGYQKNGGLTSFARSVRPTLVMATDQLSSARDLWNVPGNEGAPGYLVLSLPTFTMVLSTGGDLQQITDSGFNTEVPTVLVHPIAKGQLIVQVGYPFCF